MSDVNDNEIKLDQCRKFVIGSMTSNNLSNNFDRLLDHGRISIDELELLEKLGAVCIIGKQSMVQSCTIPALKTYIKDFIHTTFGASNSLSVCDSVEVDLDKLIFKSSSNPNSTYHLYIIDYTHNRSCILHLNRGQKKVRRGWFSADEYQIELQMLSIHTFMSVFQLVCRSWKLQLLLDCKQYLQSIPFTQQQSSIFCRTVNQIMSKDNNDVEEITILDILKSCKEQEHEIKLCQEQFAAAIQE
jgi:hypothetical protein